MRSTDHWESYFDERFEEPDPWDYEGSTYEQRKYRQQISVLDDHLESPSRILEIGCSEGVHSALLLEAFSEAELLGISLSEQEVKRARERIDDERATFVAANAVDYLPDLDGTFDAVVWSETIYYIGDTVSVPEMCELIGTVFDRLKPGGVLVSANIVGQEDTEESRLTRPAILNAYREFMAGFSSSVHYSSHIERKASSGNEHKYEIWGYQRPKN